MPQTTSLCARHTMHVLIAYAAGANAKKNVTAILGLTQRSTSSAMSRQRIPSIRAKTDSSNTHFHPGKKFREVFNEVSSLYGDMDAEERNRLNEYNRDFRRMEAHGFFRKVGEFEGFRQESSILQQRTGYSQIYKSWLMLKNSLDLVNGKTDVGMKKIWELYEIWCFLVMKRLIAKVLHLELSDAEHVRENKAEMINTMQKSEMTHVVEFDNISNGDVVRLEYQHTYNRKSKDVRTTTNGAAPRYSCYDQEA